MSTISQPHDYIGKAYDPDTCSFIGLRHATAIGYRNQSAHCSTAMFTTQALHAISATFTTIWLIVREASTFDQSPGNAGRNPIRRRQDKISAALIPLFTAWAYSCICYVAILSSFWHILAIGTFSIAWQSAALLGRDCPPRTAFL